MFTRILALNNAKPIINNARIISFTQCKFCGTNTKGTNYKSHSEEFTPIYKFPQITALSTLNRLKIYHTFVTCLAIPGSIILNQLNIIESDGVIVTCSLGFSGCAVLYSLSYFTQNFIGFIYVNKTGNQVKVSYLDFWGRRRNEIIDTEDIVPMSDMPVAFTDKMYVKLARFSVKHYRKLNLQYGVVLDKEKFEKVLK